MPRKSHPPGAPPELFTPATITFRFDDPEERRVLAERAAQLGVSPHELARHYVREILQQAEEREALREAIKQLNKNQRQFHKDFAFAVQALLTSAGKVSSQKAEAWVAESKHVE